MKGSVSMKLFTLMSSHSSRSAKRFLTEHNFAFEECRMSKGDFTFDMFKYMMSRTEFGASDILANSKKLREINASDKTIDDYTLSELYHLVFKHPTLMRAPILISENRMIIGFDLSMYESLMPRHIRKKAYYAALDKANSEDNEMLMPQ